jgi:hypothetical protein
VMHTQRAGGTDLCKGIGYGQTARVWTRANRLSAFTIDPGSAVVAQSLCRRAYECRRTETLHL